MTRTQSVAILVVTLAAIAAGVFLDLSRADWAGWIQAVGSILAVAGVALLATRSERQQEQRAFQVADVFSQHLIATLAEIRDELERNKADQLGRLSFVLDELLLYGRSVQIAALPPHLTYPFFGLLSIAAEGRGNISPLVAGRIYNFRHWQMEFEGLRGRAEGIYTFHFHSDRHRVSKRA